MSKTLQHNQLLRLIFITLTAGCVGCSNVSNLLNTSSTTTVTSDELNSNLPRVVATTSVLCDLIKQVAAQTVALTCLIPPEINPHLYQPKTEDRQALNEANIIFFNGYNFEPNLFKVIKASKNGAAKIAVAQRAVPKPLQYRKDGRIVPDPHVWHNPKNGMRMVEVISANLSKVSPEHTSIYKSNTQKIKQELTQLDTWIKSRIASIPPKNRELITVHNTMGYYAKAYNLSWTSVLQSVNNQEQIPATRVKTLVQTIKQARVPRIFIETTTNPSILNPVTQKAKVKVSKRQLFADNLGELGTDGDTYQKMLTANTRTIVEGLGGTYLIFEPHTVKN
ncbi:zinc ABC transporter substrate-binding protein [Chlorogloeopsis sp. ULAP01]|uniref:metal ABC transporter solute-binding protein, Zn/Mn family n=1 Tax=Chlorogloeopsis sp. ULAP01 TaxID=3056483 RepID=UPI0025AA96DF|nr:zinc ABC transporter substrate-binding protein [Chlorogloeopsis sp. ULAP01]MDM9384759.1 zinc ABC transporter substrate-binding protein [Chlorogloeopsis sp. ULAP01]